MKFVRQERWRRARQMNHQPAAGAAEDRAAGEHLRAGSGRLTITWQASCPLELGEQIEEQQHRTEGRFGGEELFQTETMSAQIMLQLAPGRARPVWRRPRRSCPRQAR